MNVRNAVKAPYQDLGFTRTKIAKRSEVPATILYDIENSLSLPSQEATNPLSLVHKIPVAYLI